MKIFFLLIQTLLIIAIAPFLSGLIKKIKNNLRMRRGAPVLQPYYNLSKLFMKDSVISENSSWIFKVTPYVILGSAIAAAFLLPVFSSEICASFLGDFFLLIFILALGRFFLSLAGLDTASPFGGMGSSREMFISSLVEPVIFLAVFAVSMNAKSTSLDIISGLHALKLSSLIAAAAIFTVMVAETSRLPVDNQETHLELTMIHEATVLEYSGRSLGLIELASHIKQIIFFTVLANVILPFGLPGGLCGISPVAGLGIYAAKLLALCFITAALEISIAKMRLFRVVDFFSFSFVLAIMAVIVSAMGL
jgi:formate hydrogenlyase subunit 4